MAKTTSSDLSDFTTGSIPKKLIRFMLPTFASLILQNLYGAVDLFVVGHFGTTAGVSAVATGAGIMDMIMFLILGMTTGVTILVSQYMGRKDHERLADTIGGSICFFTAFAILLTILFLVLAPQIAHLMQSPPEAFDLAVTYIRICGGGMIFVVAYNTISCLYRGFGNSKLPLVFVAVACLVNIIGDLALVAGLHMNVAGAAIATVGAQALSVVFALFITKRRDLPFSLHRSNLRFNEEVKKFTKLGIPIAIQNFMTSVSFLALCSFVNRISLPASSGYGIANKITNFTQLIPSTLLTSMSPFVGQNVGAGDEKRAKKTMYTGMWIGLIVGIPVALLVIFGGSLLGSIFIKDPAVITRTAEYLRGYSIEPLVTSLLFSLMSYFNGHGKTRFVMIQGLIQAFAFRVPIAYFMSIRPDASLFGVGLATPVSTIAGILLCIIYLVHFQKKRASATPA